jgi:hypothetical protein
MRFKIRERSHFPANEGIVFRLVMLTFSALQPTHVPNLGLRCAKMDDQALTVPAQEQGWPNTTYS